MPFVLIHRPRVSSTVNLPLELKVSGLSTGLGALCFGFPCYIAVVNTLMIISVGGKGRRACLLSGIFSGVLTLAYPAAEVSNYIPVPTIAAILMFFGLDLLIGGLEEAVFLLDWKGRLLIMIMLIVDFFQSILWACVVWIFPGSHFSSLFFYFIYG